MAHEGYSPYMSKSNRRVLHSWSNITLTKVMANDSEHANNDKDDGNINSEGRLLNDDASNIVGSETLDKPGSRRSFGDSSSKKKMLPSPASSWKSERLEKRSPTTPPVKMKSMIVARHMQNALRRSETGKKQSPSRSSGSKCEKSSTSSDAEKPKDKRDKTVKQLTLETREVKEIEKQDTKLVQMKKKTGCVSAYLAFHAQNASKKVNASGKELDRLGKSESDKSRGRNPKKVSSNHNHNKNTSKLMEQYVQKPLDAGMPTPRPLIHGGKALEDEDGDGLQKVKSDDSVHAHYTVFKKMGSLERPESTIFGVRGDAKVSLVESHKVSSLKRKRETDMDPEGKRTETCGTCLKRQRIVSSERMNIGRDKGNVASESKEGGSKVLVDDVHDSLSRTSHIEWEGGRKVCDAQKSLHLLKPEISKLCETLQLSEDIKGMAEKFFEYIMNNHSISKERLQAFQISVCWIAASFLKKKIDQKQSLVLAQQHLNFCCNEEEANYVYLKLCCLKRLFLFHTGYHEIAKYPRVSSFSSEDEPFSSPNACNHQQEDTVDQSLSIDYLVERDTSVSIKKLQKKCDKQLSNLIRKEREEVNELYRSYEEEKVELEKRHRTELAVMRCLDRSSSGTDRLKMLENSFAIKAEQHKQQLNTRLEDLVKIHVSARKKVEQKFALLEDEVKSLLHVELLNRKLSDELGCILENPQIKEQRRVQDGTGNVSVEKQSPCGIAYGSPIDVVKPIEIPKVTSVVGSSGDQIGAVIHPGDLIEAVNQPDRNSHSSCPDTEKVLCVTPHSLKKQNPDAAVLSISDEEARRGVLKIGDVQEDVHVNRETGSVNGMASDRPNATTTGQQNGEGSTINQNSLLEELYPLNGPLVHSECTLPQGNPLHLDQAIQDQCSLPLISTEMQDGGEPSSKKGNDTGQGEAPQSHPNYDTVQSDDNSEALTIEPVVQSHLSLTNTSPNENPLDLSSAGGIGHIPITQEQQNGNGIDVQCVGDHEASVMETLLDHLLQEQCSMPLRPPLSQRIDPLPSEHRIHEAVVRDPLLQLQPSASMDSFSSHSPLLASRPSSDSPQWRQIQPIHAVSQMHLPLSHDPLQKELDKICRGIDHSTKTHEDEKLQLKVDCEKEIEEIAAQIHIKYEIKLQEYEVEFSRKKKEMDASHNKILMNKILAETFRCKCMEDTVPSFRQRTGHRPPFVTSLSVTPSQHHPVTMPQSSTPPAAGLHTTASPQHPVNHYQPLAGTPTISSQTSRPISHLTISRCGGTEIRAPAPHLQRLRPSASVTSLPPLPCGLPSQQPPNTALIPPSVILPAHPHSMPSQQAPHSHMMPSQQAPHSHMMPSQQAPHSHMMPSQQAPHFHRMPSQQAPHSANSSTPLSSSSLPPFPRWMPSQPEPNTTSYPPTHLSSTSLSAPDTGRSLISLSSTSARPLPNRVPSHQAPSNHPPGPSSSVLELAYADNRQFGATLPDILSPLPDLGYNLDMGGLSGLGSRGSYVGTRPPAASLGNVVSLSDDD